MHTIQNDLHKDRIVKVPTFQLPEQFTEDEKIRASVLFADGCVLQANMAVRLWGSCKEDGGIAVRVIRDEDGSKQLYYGKMKDGFFEVYIDAPDYGGPYTLEFLTEHGGRRTVRDVLFGEVFILAGQSNMGWAMIQCYLGDTNTMLYQDIMDSCEDPDLRQMLVWPVSSETPVEELTSCRSWRKINPETIKDFSAVGYFFGRRLRELFHVPVGLVSACMGGIPISQWVVGGEWYNGQVHPIRRLTARGVLWYQGEGDPVNYGARLAALIQEWREKFENPELWWATVQLPRYVDEDSYFVSREEDKKAGTLADNYTYCVTIDTGLYPELAAKDDPLNTDGIHPYDEYLVGTRLADAVAGKFYGCEGLWSSPYAQDAKLQPDGTVVVSFANVGGGLLLEGRAGFELAGADGIYYDAVPTLHSDHEIALHCDAAANPRAVRYGYKNYSTLIDAPITCCAQSVCVYNTKPDGPGKEKAYPAEQFRIEL